MKKTPSGVFPVLLPKPLYDAAEKAGYDMRWYDIVKRIPVKPTEMPTGEL